MRQTKTASYPAPSVEATGGGPPPVVPTYTLAGMWLDPSQFVAPQDPYVPARSCVITLPTTGKAFGAIEYKPGILSQSMASIFVPAGHTNGLAYFEAELWWLTDDADVTNGVTWNLYGNLHASNTDLDTAIVTFAPHTQVSGGVNYIMRQLFNIAVGSPAVPARFLTLLLEREGTTDIMPGNAYCLGIGLNYQIDLM